MKTSIKFLLVSVFLLAFDANSAIPNFNHGGIQKGAYTESCYHNPCSGAKVMKFDILKKTPDSTLIKLKLVGASRDWGAKKLIWNHESHDVYITCSIKKPSIKAWDEVTILSFDTYGVPGVLESSASLYLRACHNYVGSVIKAARKYNYKIEEF